jgi:hypothetical protein
MDRLGDQFLPSTAFPVNVNGRLGLGDARHGLQHSLHIFAFRNDVGEIILLFEQSAQPLIFRSELAAIQRPVDL